MAINLDADFATSRSEVREMRDRRGSVVLVAPDAALVGTRNSAALRFQGRCAHARQGLGSYLAESGKNTTLGHVARLEEVAEALSFLVSDRSFS